jgi:HAD superfamily hydrolase (TIGR01549 family)
MPSPNTSLASGRAVGAVVFDMDGTLTHSPLDFDAIRREIGLPVEPRTPILEAIARMGAAERSRAETILHRHEERAALSCELQEHALEVLANLRQRRIPIGLLTRNSRRSVDQVLARHGLRFDCVHTREDGPIKPSPDALLSMCRRWSVPPAASWMVGDYLFDVQAGRAAGLRTVLLIDDRPPPDYADQADHVIRCLSELPGLLF